ncbi:GlcG/HbpS family heme-binding protein [Desulfogranum japonicum]|uniref:GlcG/HbpS family heme-binding protein n=1 Tax=Desulfogranum japonicum TaxID=231447 RepID=UPI000420CF4E|nr:heme-binding protein [Desulfogranum japonicum]
MNISLDDALVLMAAARKKADEIGVPMVIAVVDTGGNLVAEHRMDDALLVSVDIARNKAYTSVAVKVATEDLAKAAQPGESLYGIHATDQGRIVIFGGGVPLYRGETLIGGLGVSGGSVEQDVSCAKAGQAALSL